MTLLVQSEILMDAEQAKAELRATGTAAKSTSRDLRALGADGERAARGMDTIARATAAAQDGTQQMSAELIQLRARFDPLFAMSQRYEAELSELNRAQRLGALTARQYDAALDRLNADFARHATGARGLASANQAVAASNRLAAGSMGNLVAQGNDVIQMLMAGQNPLQLAVQQGTQITQVIGPLGAAGAFRALGGAVMSMLSPINLITIGAIAATAAVVNWLTSGTDEAQSFADRIETLGNGIDSLRDKIEEASRTRVELAEEFGESFVERAQDLLDRIVEAEQRFAGRQATATITSFLDETGIDLQGVLDARNPDVDADAIISGIADSGQLFDVARQFELTEGLFGRLRDENRQLAQDVLDDLADLSRAAEGTLQEQQAALAALIESYDRAAVASGSRSDEELANLQLLRQQELELARVIELQKQDPAENRRTEEMLTFLAAVTRSTEEQLRANTAAEEMLGTMNEQLAIARATARFGADSAGATRLRAQFALDAKLEEIEALRVSEDKKETLREAAQAMFDLSVTDASGAIGAAANEAARLNAEVQGAVSAMFELASRGDNALERARVRAEFKDDPVARAGALAALEFDTRTEAIPSDGFENAGEEAFLNNKRQEVIDEAREIARLNQLARPTRSGSGTRRSPANEAERERQNIDRLIASKQRELDVLRESDPVQREMIRLRERLTAATPKQRREIEATIEAHQRETEAMQRKDEFEQGLGDVLMEAESLRDVWGGIGDMIARAAKEALVLGTGPLGNLVSGIFGGGDGGIVGAISGLLEFADGGLPAARLPAFAAGGDPRPSRPGIVLGAGSGRSDSIVARISAGEFIMNSQATARNRDVLEAMNAGAVLPGFANGGQPLPRAASDGARAGRAGRDGGGITRLRIEPSDLFLVVAEERARDVAVQVTSRGLEQYDRETLPRSVQRINGDPREIG